jgi:hypothetical protein
MASQAGLDTGSGCLQGVQELLAAWHGAIMTLACCSG